jgi:hypothetical protein
MKCPNCSYKNESNSTFCQECGYELSKSKSAKNKKSTSPIKEFENEIEDILFTPRKGSSHLLRNIGIGILAIVVIIFGLAYYGSNSNTASTTNNYSTPTPQYDPNVAPGSTFDLSKLSLTNTKMYGNSSYSVNPSLTGTLYNSSNIPATDVILRIRFYSTEAATVPQDTQYIDVATYLGAGDSTNINTIVKTNFNTSGDFWWKADIYSAK